MGLRALYDSASRRYYLLLRSAGTSAETVLVAFAGDAALVTLDEATVLAVFPDTPVALLPATAPAPVGDASQQGPSSESGGVLVVSPAGDVSFVSLEGKVHPAGRRGGGAASSTRVVAAAVFHEMHQTSVAVACTQRSDPCAVTVDIFTVAARGNQGGARLRHGTLAELRAPAGAHLASVACMGPGAAAIVFDDGTVTVLRCPAGILQGDPAPMEQVPPLAASELRFSLFLPRRCALRPGIDPQAALLRVGQERLVSAAAKAQRGQAGLRGEREAAVDLWLIGGLCAALRHGPATAWSCPMP